ncbi:MAG: flavin reductase [Acetobacteraceae bacterium]
MKVSATDWLDGGWDLAQTVEYAKELKKRGADWITASSGGISPLQKITVGPNYQVPFAAGIKDGANTNAIAVASSPNPNRPRISSQAARPISSPLRVPCLYDPRWPWHAAAQLGANGRSAPAILALTAARAGGAVRRRRVRHALRRWVTSQHSEFTVQFDFSALTSQQRYKLLGSTITPRPIAWVSSLNAKGQPNAAPFSYFNVFSEDPPILAFSILSRSPEDPKDTGRNVRRQQEFVVNLVSEDNLDKMNVSAIEFAPGVSEFTEARLTALPSSRIRTPRIAESHVSFECKLMQVIELGRMRSLILGEVLAMHIRDDAVIDAERCWIDTPRLRIIGRTAANSYIRTADVLTLPSIPIDKWLSRTTGIDEPIEA